MLRADATGKKAVQQVNKLMIFNSGEFGQIRSVVLNSEPWFVAADVCRALEIGNPTDALQRLEDDERTLVSIEGASNGRPVNAVNEPGLYTLVLGSRKLEAKKFKRWIAHEVIPSIRKKGAYAVPAMCIEDVLIQSLQEMKDVKMQLAHTTGRVDNIEEVLTLDTSEWRVDTKKLVVKIAHRRGGIGQIDEIYTNIYEKVERRAGVNLGRRLDNLRSRMIMAGAGTSSVAKANKIDVIGADKKLIEIYMAVVKEMAVKAGVSKGGAPCLN